VAKETITTLIDDLDGTKAAETVMFSLDGHLYEIDLSTKNAGRLRAALAQYIDVAAPVHAPRGRIRAAAGRRASAPPVSNRDQNQTIRAWAARKGFDISPRGRIRQEIIDQYFAEAGR
jgi:hypothetical protein